MYIVFKMRIKHNLTINIHNNCMNCECYGINMWYVIYNLVNSGLIFLCHKLFIPEIDILTRFCYYIP